MKKGRFRSFYASSSASSSLSLEISSPRSRRALRAFMAALSSLRDLVFFWPLTLMTLPRASTVSSCAFHSSLAASSSAAGWPVAVSFPAATAHFSGQTASANSRLWVMMTTPPPKSLMASESAPGVIGRGGVRGTGFSVRRKFSFFFRRRRKKKLQKKKKKKRKKDSPSASRSR